MDDDVSEMIERVFRAYNEGGPTAFIDVMTKADALSPDFVMEIQDDLPNGGEWAGAEGFAEMARLWLEAWKSFEVQPGVPARVGDDRYLVPVRQRAVARGSGIALDEPFVYALTFDDGRLRRVGLFKDRDLAERSLSSGG